MRLCGFLCLTGILSATALSGMAPEAAAASPKKAATAAKGKSKHDFFEDGKKTLPLSEEWRFKADPKEEGESLGWHGEAFNDSDWQTLPSGASWVDQGLNYDGAAWCRQRIVVPEDWAGQPLTLKLGPVGIDDETYFNGVKIGKTGGEYLFNAFKERAYAVPPQAVRCGQANTIAVKVWGHSTNHYWGKSNSGLVGKGLCLEAKPFGIYARPSGGGSDTELPLRFFDVGEAQWKPFELVFRLPEGVSPDPGLLLSFSVHDAESRLLKEAQGPLERGDGKILRAAFKLSREEAAEIALRNCPSFSLTVSNAEGKKLFEKREDIGPLNYGLRDRMALPELPPETRDTPYGSLRLVDAIDCSAKTLDDPHPYIEGRLAKIQSNQPPMSKPQIEIRDYLGKSCRWVKGWFAYRIGRGKIKPGGTYLLRIEYPDTFKQYATMEVSACHNYMDLGWRSGVSPDNPYDNWPLSGLYQHFDCVVCPDKETYGYQSAGGAPGENGFWVFVVGKTSGGDKDKYFSAYDEGAAVRRIELYELDPQRDAPTIRFPEGMPRRTLAFDWERNPQGDPDDVARYAKMMGYNAVSPCILKWHFMLHHRTKLGYNSVGFDSRGYPLQRLFSEKAEPGAVLDSAPGQPTVHERYLAATAKYGVDYLPRIEYGGSLSLPEEAKAIGPNGQPAKPNRFAEWCANLLHPATWDDVSALLSELIEPYAKENPQLKGILWRIRCNRMPASFGKQDIELFGKETGTPVPDKSAKALALWASDGPASKDYGLWWHRKRFDFQMKMLAQLKSCRQDMRLYFCHWDGDGWCPLLPVWFSWRCAGRIEKYNQNVEMRKACDGKACVEMLRSGSFYWTWPKAEIRMLPHLRVIMDPYKDAEGVSMIALVGHRYLSDSQDYLDYFSAKGGLAVSNMMDYDELGNRCINSRHETNMILPSPAPFSMANEVLSCFHGDPFFLTYTAYTFGRGFADAHRRFAQAYLALPAVKGEIVDGALAQPSSDIKVRKYSAADAVYVGIVNRALEGRKCSVSMPGAWKGGEKVFDLVLGKDVPCKLEEGRLSFEMETGPMQLNSFRIK